MSKFEKTLAANSKTIKANRAKLIAQNAEEAQNEILRVLRKEKRDLEFKLLNLTDIAPDSELSLRVVRTDFDACKLFKEIQEIKVDLANKTVEVEIAEKTYQEWFGDEA